MTIASQAAFAQNSAAEESDPGAIIVTARRFEERLQDVPISITVFNQQQLAHRNVTSGVDLAIYTPSLQANSRYGVENTSFAIRGVAQEQRTTASVAISLTDVELVDFWILVSVADAGRSTGTASAGGQGANRRHARHSGGQICLLDPAPHSSIGAIGFVTRR
jgi:predicted alpha/beta hydrolase